MSKVTKEIKDAILYCTRLAIYDASSGDEDAWFEINRWVYQRLKQDEKSTQPDKSTLLDRQRGRCWRCKGRISDIKEADRHRLDRSKTYTEENNVVIICKQCHKELTRLEKK